MTWGIVAGVGGSLVGGLMSSKASRDSSQVQADAAKAASDAQLAATRDTNQLTADMYRNSLANGAPYQQGGQVALSALMSGMGLGGARAAPGAGGMTPSTPGANGQAPLGTYVNAYGQAVDPQGNPITTGGTTNYGITGLNYGATQDELDAAAGAVPAGTFQETFTGQDIYMDPSYQFRLDEGTRNLRAQQAAGGNRWGGQAMKDITTFGQNLASTEFGAANDRFMRNKAVLYDRLSNLAGLGSAAGNAASAAGSSAASNIGANTMTGVGNSNSYLTSGAAATAGGIQGSTNALVNGANNAANNWYTMQYLKGPQGGGGGYYPGNMTGFYGGNGTSGD